MEFFIMSRSGEFLPKDYTKNQCQRPGMPAYHYEIKMAFPKTTKLDSNKFIVDHQRVHDLIHSLPLEGSCEEMQMAICSAVKKFFHSLGERLYGCDCRLIPPVGGAAYMSYAYIDDDLSDVNKSIICSLIR